MKPPAKPETDQPATDPQLAPLRESFERGDFSTLHVQLAQLPDDKRGAASTSAFRGATTVDPAHVAVLALCVLALIAITLKYLS